MTKVLLHDIPNVIRYGDEESYTDLGLDILGIVPLLGNVKYVKGIGNWKGAMLRNGLREIHKFAKGLDKVNDMNNIIGIDTSLPTNKLNPIKSKPISYSPPFPQVPSFPTVFPRDKTYYKDINLKNFVKRKKVYEHNRHSKPL